MNIITKPTFTATVTIGMQFGYSKQFYQKSEFVGILQKFQQQQIAERKVYLSACISECDLILSGQVEPHLKLDFINYPKFPLEEKQFKSEIELLVTSLMNELEQNRIVIVYHNETKMFEKSKEIDPRIL
ncbi:hypothetical protein ACFQ5N_01070 [Lutibacter holmesii]|uniref:DUF190 domain-containing protein n=1 Tax=Lutibacter holmesii TaxID=1137985 RepID=A0ABW3WL78_9FLAO